MIFIIWVHRLDNLERLGEITEEEDFKTAAEQRLGALEAAVGSAGGSVARLEQALAEVLGSIAAESAARAGLEARVDSDAASQMKELHGKRKLQSAQASMQWLNLGPDTSVID